MAHLQYIPINTLGRDFIVGDIHGCLDDLYLELHNKQFDSSKDRLFSVGDLVDRGPQSLEVIKTLLQKDWFYPVLGNHELMLIDAVLKDNPDTSRTLYDLAVSGYRYALHYLQEGGDWAENFTVEALLPIVEKLQQLPSVICVDTQHQVPFLVAHASLHNINDPVGHKYSRYTLQDISTWNVCPRTLYWSRDLIKKINDNYSVSEHTLDGQLINIFTHETELKAYNLQEPLVYVGHSTLNKIALVDNTVYIDTGSFFRHYGVEFKNATYNTQGKISIIEHNQLIHLLSTG